MLNEIKASLRQLKFYHAANQIEILIERAKDNDLSYLTFLFEFLTYEINLRKKGQITRKIKQAKFPALKTVDEFDFSFQTTITKRQVNEWMSFDWIEQRHNKILMGPPGTGKTHLAIAAGYAAIFKGYRVLFYSMQKLLEEMILAEDQGTFVTYLKQLLKNDLIIIDEIGYLPLKPVYANLFFQLINQAYEYRSIFITSNKLFNEWGRYFGDKTIATAILDRLLHHSQNIMLNGDSYRLKGKLQIQKEA